MNSSQKEQKEKKRQQRSRRRIIRMITILSIVGISSYFAIQKYMPNFEEIPFFTYYPKWDTGNNNLLLVDKLLDLSESPIIQNELVYLPVGLVQEYIDPYIFWDPQANRLTVTTENKVIQMRTEELTYYINHKPMQLAIPVTKKDNIAYLPQSILEQLYNIELQYSDTYKIVSLDYKDIAKKKATLLKKSDMRYEPSIKSPIEQKINSQTEVTVFTQEGEFTKIRTDSGLIGYVKTKDLGKIETIAPTEKEKEPVTSTIKPLTGKISIVWDQVTTVEANTTDERKEPLPGITVLSPTWFSFDAEKKNGDIINIADKSYVDWAHENGHQVWALLSDNFDGDINEAVLSSTENREHVIKQLLSFVAIYELDGINIDFEAVRKATAANYLQFLRELKPLLNEQGAFLSVDLFVPSPWSMYYNRTEVGKTVDYVCVMTYDEHTSVSETTGPVASLSFVDNGIKDTISEVPKEKVIMGIPFYVRVWREEETDGVVSFTLRNYGMNAARTIFEDKGASFTWLADIGSYYAEYKETEEGKEVTYKVWLEDERSIQEKLSIANKYGIAGIAMWKRGLEKKEVWESINQYLQ